MSNNEPNPIAITVNDLRKTLEEIPGELKIIIYDIGLKFGYQVIGGEHIKLEPGDKPCWTAPTFTLFINSRAEDSTELMR